MPFTRAPLPKTAQGDAPMPSSFDDDLEIWEEKRWGKLWRRLKEEPLIPVGLALTCYALYGATRSIRRGDKTATNAYFRARVYAQGATIVCLCVGSIYYRGEREKRKHFEGLLAEKRAQDRREAWLRELEARDLEEQEQKARREKQKQAIRDTEIKKLETPPNTDTANLMLEKSELHRLFASPIAFPAMLLWNR